MADSDRDVGSDVTIPVTSSAHNSRTTLGVTCISRLRRGESMWRSSSLSRQKLEKKVTGKKGGAKVFKLCGKILKHVKKLHQKMVDEALKEVEEGVLGMDNWFHLKPDLFYSSPEAIGEFKS